MDYQSKYIAINSIIKQFLYIKYDIYSQTNLLMRRGEGTIRSIDPGSNQSA